MDALAIVACRNEELQVKRCLNHLISIGFDVILLDHESSDGSREIASELLGAGLLTIETLRWEGVFSLQKQLETKQKIIQKYNHKWIGHFDMDEMPFPHPQFSSLREGIKIADQAGYSVINFNELVFLPPPRDSSKGLAVPHHALTYYFFEPNYPRLQRIWRRSANANNIGSGGHRLNNIGKSQIFPFDFILRHNIVLDEDHAIQKYLTRSFSSKDLANGWHGNRIKITEKSLRDYFRGHSDSAGKLKMLSHYHSVDYDLSAPQQTHFWEWS